jgi:hypothetical protein
MKRASSLISLTLAASLGVASMAQAGTAPDPGDYTALPPSVIIVCEIAA